MLPTRIKTTKYKQFQDTYSNQDGSRSKNSPNKEMPWTTWITAVSQAFEEKLMQSPPQMFQVSGKGGLPPCFYNDSKSLTPKPRKDTAQRINPSFSKEHRCKNA